MSDDFLTRVQQLQFSNPNLNGDNVYGASSLGGFGVNTQNMDIWTQASQLENKYKSQLQVAATMSNSTETTKVMNNFMNEALDLLFNSLNTQSSASKNTAAPAASNSSANTSNNAAQASVQEKPEPSKTPSVTKDAEKTTNTSDVKKYTEKIDESFKKSTEGAAKAQNVISNAMKDDNLSPKEKSEINSYYQEKAKEQGVTDRTTWKEEALVKEVYDKLKEDPSFTASEAIKVLKDIETKFGKDKKGNQKHLASFYQDSANFAMALYLKAQKEGNLKEALAVVPPTESIQKKLSLGKETKAILSLIQGLDKNAKELDQSEDKNHGISKARQQELDKEFDEIAKKYEKRTLTAYDALEKDFFPKLFESGNYTDNEKVYLLEKAYENIGYLNLKTQTTTKTEFVEAFRDMSWKAQEKYFTNIVEAYGGYSP